MAVTEWNGLDTWQAPTWHKHLVLFSLRVKGTPPHDFPPPLPLPLAHSASTASRCQLPPQQELSAQNGETTHIAKGTVACFTVSLQALCLLYFFWGHILKMYRTCRQTCCPLRESEGVMEEVATLRQWCRDMYCVSGNKVSNLVKLLGPVSCLEAAGDDSRKLALCTVFVVLRVANRLGLVLVWR